MGASEKPHSHQSLIPFNIDSVTLQFNFKLRNTEMYNFIAHINQEVDHESKQW